jgi:hypothetical protein
VISDISSHTLINEEQLKWYFIQMTEHIYENLCWYR